MSAEPIANASAEIPARGATPLWQKLIPYLGTVAIFALIFWRIPLAKVAEALSQAPILKFFAIFMPFSLFYFAIDSFCLKIGRAHV